MLDQFLKRLSFPVKLMLVGFIPLAFLIYMTFEVNKEQQQKINVLDNFKNRVQQTGNIAGVVDALQAERKYSAGFIVDKSNLANMVIRRNTTDQAIAELDLLVDARLMHYKFYTFLEQLPAFRKRVDEGNLNNEELMTFYSNTILRLSSLAYISTESIPFLEPLNNSIKGQRTLAEMISSFGFMRLVYYNDFYTKKDPQVTALKILGPFDVYLSYEKEFRIKAPPEAQQRYLLIRNQNAMRTSINTLETLFKNGTFNKSMDAETWWDVSASVVDQLKVLQRQLLKNVIIKTGDIYEKEKSNKDRNLILLILVVAIVIVFIIYIIKNISASLIELKNVAKAIALGKTGNKISFHSTDVIGSLAESILLVDAHKVELASAADEIGKGNFEVEIVVRSAEDKLGHAIKRMKEDLQRFVNENQEDIWIRDGITAINESTRGEKEIHRLSKDALDVFVENIGAQVGVFYTAMEERLYLFATYGIADNVQLPESFPFGTNQAGRAAENKKIVQLDNIPENYLNITSTTGAIHPKHILILPLLFNHVVEGVIEVAALNPFSKAAIKLMEASIPAIAIALQASKSRGKLQEMLEETQAQTEELQAQQSELENLNEELEVQAQKLQASEEELRVQQEELQQTNNELVQQTSLLEEKNREVNRKAEELVITTRYKSEFLANMSHELRTPLNSILLLSRLLSDNISKNLNKDQVEYAQVILSSGNGLLGLIDEILDLSKIEAGKMQLDYQTIKVNEIVQDLLGLFKQLAVQKKIDFDIEIGKNVPELIETDKQRLEQILKNLLSNAFKFTHIGEVKMKIIINPDNPSFISIEVKDSGIGIAPAQQPLIFEAFQQADGSTRRKYGGTGLGLSISRELAKLLGGEILLSSEENIGSIFTLNLPLKKALHIEDKQSEVNEAVIVNVKPSEVTIMEDSKYLASYIPNNIADDRATTGPSDKCILIVEDDTNFAKSLLDFTRQQGYKGIIAVRGDEGLELARQFLPIGILLDIQLPVISGWEVMDALKKDPRTKNIPVHIMSSHAVASESITAGAVDFINKSMVYDQMPEIFKRIESILSKKSNKVLIIEENNVHSKALAFYLESFKIKTKVLSNMQECAIALQSKEVGCVILDIGIPDMATYEKLEETKKITGLENLPIILFTGKNLSQVEEQKIKKYADSIIVKTAYSYQRILDEISLFLNLVGDPLKAAPKIIDYKKLNSLGQALNNKTVLVVDDDVRNIFSLTKTLENFKMHVLTAVDGNEALQMLREHPEINLVLLDMMMPQMDGYETAGRIRKDLQWKNLPVIAVTAKAMTGDREKCIKAGASDYITKPVDIDQLLSLMRVWLYERA